MDNEARKTWMIVVTRSITILKLRQMYFLSILQDAYRLWAVELGGAHVFNIKGIVCGRMSRMYRYIFDYTPWTIQLSRPS
jgi:hypothetical protein